MEFFDNVYGGGGKRNFADRKHLFLYGNINANRQATTSQEDLQDSGINAERRYETRYDDKYSDIDAERRHEDSFGLDRLAGLRQRPNRNPPSGGLLGPEDDPRHTSRENQIRSPPLDRRGDPPNARLQRPTRRSQISAPSKPPPRALEHASEFHRWFATVRAWHWAAAAVWHTAIVFPLLQLSTLCLFGVSTWASRAVSLRHFYLSAVFVFSQLIILACQLSQFNLRLKAYPPLDTVVIWFISPRTLTLVPGALASAYLAAYSYLRLTDAIHGDGVPGSLSPQLPTHASQVAYEQFVSTGVLVMGLMYGVWLAVGRSQHQLFPSLQRRRMHNVKGVLPVCVSRALAISLGYTAVWSLTGSYCFRLFSSRTTVVGPSSASAYALFALTLILLTCWEMARELAWIVMTKRIRFRLKDLLVAISEISGPYAQHMGFCYLEALSQSLPEERKKIFSLDRNAGVSQWRIVSESITRVLQAMATELNELTHATPRQSRCSWLFDISRNRLATALASELQLCVWAAHSASFLTVAALGEDRDGEVQRTFPVVLNSLLALSIAIQNYIQSEDPDVFVGSEKRSTQLHGHQLARSEWVYLATHVDNAIYRIVGGYYQHLREFEFSPQHAERLKRYVAF